MHTPEPWTIDAEGWSDAADLIENHPRIVACVNACRGITTESLTDGAVVRLVEAAKYLLDAAPNAGFVQPDYESAPEPAKEADYHLDCAKNKLAAILRIFKETKANE